MQVRGWGKVRIVMDKETIIPLCRHPYPNHPNGCTRYCKVVFYDQIIDPGQEIWALYFSLNLEPQYAKFRRWHPEWSELQVKNLRYWIGTRKKLIRKIEQEFLVDHPGPWARIIKDGKRNYTIGIHYTETMKQLGVELQWPPGDRPITVQFLGRPIRELPKGFMLCE